MQRIIFCCLGLLLPLTASSSARAQSAASTTPASPAGSGAADQFHGSFGTSVTLEVPPFHNIEPHLSLEYTSSTGNGFAGIGWSLAGFSAVERMSPGRGAPFYTSADVFVLDGQELTPCTSSSFSPSCMAGGTHSTQVESYARIAFNSATSTWVVTQKDGTQSLYSPVYSVTPGTFRWGMTKVTDLSGNTVNYGWACDGTSPVLDCYPSSVSYNGVVITLYRALRPDPVAFANGSSVGQTNYRLSSIDVQLNGARARTYALTYAGTSVTSQSVLASTQQFPRDATVDAITGVVTAGATAPLPAVTMSVAPESQPLTYLSRLNLPGGYYDGFLQGGGSLPPSNALADINGDGKVDLVTYDTTGGVAGLSVWLSGSAGFGYASHLSTAGFWAALPNAQTNALVDVNGDGKTDLVSYDSIGNAWGFSIWLSNGTGFVQSSKLAAPTGLFNGYLGAGGTQSPTNALVDINGDGKADLVTYDNIGGAAGFSVWLTSCDAALANCGFVYAGHTSTAGLYSGFPNAWTNALVDVNGDGKTDLVSYDSIGNAWGFSIWLSNGTGFVQSSKLASPVGLFNGYLGAGGSQSPTNALADVNGDGRPDFITYDNTGGVAGFSVWLTSCNATLSSCSFVYASHLPTTGFWSGYPNALTNALADVNGDGKADLVSLDSSGGVWGFSTWLSNGRGFVYTSKLNSPTGLLNGYLGPGGTQSPANALADVNGDGMLDLVTFDTVGGSYGLSTFLSTGRGFVYASHLNNPTGLYTGYPNAQTNALVDVTGDGKVDLVTLDTIGGAYGFSVWALTGPPANRLTSITNGLGGTTAVSYAPGWVYSSKGPFVVPTTAALAVSDGRGNTSTTTFAYSGGLHDAVGRRFLGFHYAKATLPCNAGESACPYVETWFKQDYGSSSKPEEVRRSTGAGVLLTDTIHSYATNGATAPYTSLEAGVWVYTYDGSGSACSSWPCAHGQRSYVSRAFDNYDAQAGVWRAGYGNLVQETAYGNYDVNGDERTTVYTPAPANTAAFIVGKSGVTTAYAGIGTAGSLLTQGVVYYDGASNWNVVPTRGRPTAGLRWLNSTGAFVTTRATYDSYGNVVSESDELGNTRSYAVDATYHLFRTSATNAIGQTATVEWDPVCLTPIKQRDPNGVATTTAYDPLCRPTRRSGALGRFDKFIYVNVGDPNAGYVQSETPAAEASGNQWVRTYTDGLGRTWRTVRKGTSAHIVTDTVYGPRGMVVQASPPHYSSGETAVWVTTTYDALDRVTQIAQADGATITKSYGFEDGWGSVLTTDELGHQERETYDAYARPKYHDEWFGTTRARRTYSYDARGNPLTVSDGAGNVTSYT